MNSKNTKSSQELKKEVLRELHNVEDDLDKVKSRITPGQFIDDAIFYSHGRSQRAMFDHLKENPIGTSFLTLGTLLLMEDDRHHTYEFNLRRASVSAAQMSKHKASNAFADAKDKISSFKTNVGDKVAQSKTQVGDKISRAKTSIVQKKDDLKSKFVKDESIEGSGFDATEASDVKEKVSNSINEVKEAISTKAPVIKDQTSAKITDVRDKFSSKVPELKEAASEKLSQFRENVSGQIQSVPSLTYIALGAGLGALSGSAFPVSDKEVSFVDEKFGRQMSQFRQELKNAIDESARIIKDEFINQLKDVNVGIFDRSKNEASFSQDRPV